MNRIGLYLALTSFVYLSATTGAGASPSEITFTTKDGRTFTSTAVQTTDDGLAVLTSDGGTTIGYELLPDDLSVFPPAIQKEILKQRAVAKDHFSFEKTRPLDEVCDEFLEQQISGWQLQYAAQHPPDSVKLLVDTTPLIQSVPHREDASVLPKKMFQGTVLTPLGFFNDCFVVSICAVESYEQIEDLSRSPTEMSVNAHFEKQSDEVTGTGLIPIRNTSFSADLHDRIEKDLLEGKISLSRLHLKAPLRIPLSASGAVAGYETLDPGTEISVSEEMTDSITGSPEGRTQTITVPKISTDWDEKTTLLTNAVKLRGFIHRLNELFGKAGIQIQYDPKAQKRFAIFNESGDSWKFNPEDLSPEMPKIYDQSETQDTDAYVMYSKMDIIGHADENSVAVAGESTTAAAASHTHTTVSVYYVTVEAQPKAMLETTVPGEIQKHKLIFRIPDRAEASELADLFSDFCHTFGSSADSTTPTPRT